MIIQQQLTLFEDLGIEIEEEGLESDKNYTPSDVLDLVHQFYSYPSLDPYSCEFANRTVRAEKIFTIKDNALAQDWRGYPTIWINPPYSRGNINQAIDKLMELLSVEQPEVLLLTNSDSSTSWYKKALKRCDRFALSNTRISFYSPTRAAKGERNDNNNRPQTLFYFGLQPHRFEAVFDEVFGVVCQASRW